MVAEIIIESNVKNLNKIFDYEIPTNLEKDVLIGSRVFVPFGNKKTLEEGIVVGFKEKSEFKIKEISSIEEKKGIEEKRIELANWMSKRYFCNIADCLKLMLSPGTTSKDLNNRIKEKVIDFIELIKTQDEIETDKIQKKIRSDKQQKVLDFLLENPEVYCAELEMYTQCSRAVINGLEKKGYIRIIKKQIDRNPFIHKVNEKTNKLSFTKEQQYAYEKIEESIDSGFYSEYLLFGITGSGKTEVYLQLIEKVLKENKSSIMLVPEISLTPQTVDRFIQRFGQDKIAVLHSKLSVGERFDQWNNIKEGKAKIIIGARSAIFAPADDIGLVIIDEEHDDSYKSEMTPRYDAKDIARQIAKSNEIPLLLGSATPNLSTYYKAQNEEITLLELTKRANNANLPDVEIVDLREELANGNRSMISTKLYEEIEKNIQDKKQTILFLNRRGFSTYILCKDCGYTVKCKRCNIAMTYHKSSNKLKCHYCGYEESVKQTCPECNSSNINFYGTGTQKLEEEINKLFPTAKTIRMDIDTVTKKNSHEQILNDFKNEKKQIDILIGTQMVVKGHHFPNVTLVGVINADNNLNMEDYRANEKTFQILTQVAGRAGREKDKGRVIIQTYNPDSYVIEYAKKQDYKMLFDTEISLRKQLKYPPFCDIILIGITSISENMVFRISSQIHKYLKQRVVNEKFAVLLYSPVPAPIDKIKNRYRWRIIIKCILDDKIIDLVNDALKEFYKKNDKSSRMIVDLNPNNMM